MTWLGFSVWAYDLQRSVEIIAKGLDAAERALRADDERVKAELAETERQMAAGEIAGVEVDADGGLIHDPREFHFYDFDTIYETVNEVRKAMLIALYHAWERSARSVTGLKGNASHEEIEKALRQAEIEIVPDLTLLRKLVNLLKHNSAQKARAVWDERRDVFESGYDPNLEFANDHAASVRIERFHMNAFMRAVLASGPKHPDRL